MVNTDQFKTYDTEKVKPKLFNKEFIYISGICIYVDCEPFNKRKTRLNICVTHRISYTKKWSGSIKGCR